MTCNRIRLNSLLPALLSLGCALSSPVDRSDSGVSARADSLLRAADSIRALGQRSSADSAIIRIRRAIELAPGARAHAQMADAFGQVFSLRRTDRFAYDSAILHSNAALALDPLNTRALFARASAQGLAGDANARIAGFERVVALDSTFERVVGLLITAYADAGRDREAITLGERMRVLQPRNYQARFRLGWVYGFLWEQEKAIALFQQLSGDSASGVYRSWGNGELAYLARARGDFNAAIGHMEDGVRAVPNDLVSRLGLAMMLLTKGDPVRASPLIEQGLARDSNATGYGSFSGRLLLAWAARDLKDTALARRMFTDAERGFIASTAAGNDQSRSLLRVYALQGRIPEAVELFKRIPPANLYGGPDDNDASIQGLRGIRAFEDDMTKRRERVKARRVALGWPIRSP